MTIEDYQKAKSVMSKVEDIKAIQEKVLKMRDREDDDEFNELRSISYDSLDGIIKNLMNVFDKI